MQQFDTLTHWGIDYSMISSRVTRQLACILSMLPKAAAMYRKQIQDGRDGDERAMAKAHLILRDLPGPITLSPGKIKRVVGVLSVESGGARQGHRDSWSG